MNGLLVCLLCVVSGLKFKLHYSEGVFKDILISYKLPGIEVLNKVSRSHLENIGGN